VYLLIPRFNGMIPELAIRQLGGTHAQKAQNCAIYSGDIRSVRKPLQLEVPAKTGTKRSIYPLEDTDGTFVWAHWTDEVDVVPTPVALITDGRLHYTGHYNPKSTNLSLAKTGGSEYPESYYRLGLPAPIDGPSIAVTGGSAANVTRSYVYTFVTEWGEEGPPSPATEFTGKEDGSWDLSAMDANPSNSISISNITHASGEATIDLSADHHAEAGEYWSFSGIGGATELNGQTLAISEVVDRDSFKVEITSITAYTSGGTAAREAEINGTSMLRRIYRTDANGAFKLVADESSTSYSDTKADEDLGETLPSADWGAPPGDLHSLVLHPDGFLVGLSKNTIRFSEPYRPWAWPEAYELSMDFSGVGLGVWGDNIVVPTTAIPYLVSGTHPANVSLDQLEYHQSCVSKESIVGLQSGVMYASPDGLVVVDGGGVRLITEELMEKREWDRYNPSSIRGSTYDERYYGFYENVGDAGDENGYFVFDPKQPGAEWRVGGTHATAVHQDREADALYLMVGNSIKQFDAGGGEEQAFWRSKRFVLHRPVAFSAGKVKVTFTTDVTQAEADSAATAAIAEVDSKKATYEITTSGALAGAALGKYTVAGGPYMEAVSDTPSEGFICQVQIYAKKQDDDGDDLTLVHKEDVSSHRPFRIPTTFKSDEWELWISSQNAHVHSAVLATSIGEIAQLEAA